MDRRRFLTLAASALAAPGVIGRANASPVAGQSLPIPQILDVTGSADAALEAITNQSWSHVPRLSRTL